MSKPKADLIMHPVRMRLVISLAGRHLTAQQLAAALPDVAQASLYRHLNQLAKAGVIEISQERPVRGVVEKVYTLRENMIHLTDKDFANATPDDHMRYFITFAATMMSQFAHYLHATKTPSMLKDGVGYHQVPLYLTDEELAEMSSQLNTVLIPLTRNEPTPGRKRRLLATVVIPDTENQ